MVDKDITNRQLLEALTVKFDSRFDKLEGRFDGLETRFDGLETRFDGLETRFDGLETRFDKLEQMVVAIGDTLAGVVSTMATSQELDGLELRLGRRIDTAFSMKTAKPAR